MAPDDPDDTVRRFSDRDGVAWDVVAGRESWGALVALFVPVGPGDREVRQAPLQAPGYEHATVELGRMSEEELQALLDGSRPKTS